MLLGKSLDGGEGALAHLGEGELATAHGLAILQNGAGAADAFAAPKFSAGEAKVIPEHPEQGRLEISLHLMKLAIHEKLDVSHGTSYAGTLKGYRCFWHNHRTESLPCRESVLMRKLLLCLGIIGTMAFGAQAQAPSTGPSEKELQQPLVLDDVKPTQGQTARAEPSGWRAIGSTILVLGLAGGALWAFRRYGMKRLPGSGGGRLKVEETLALGDRRFVSILRADDDHFLLALGPQGVTLLARLDGVETAPPASFAEALDQHVALTRPTSVREVEAMMKGERP